MARTTTLVFGGRGFVGGAICRELAKRGSGASVLSVGRSSEPGAGGHLGPGVEQRAGIDAFKPDSYRELLRGAKAVVISVGEAPWMEKMSGGSKERAIKMNGESNISILNAAAEEKVPRVVLVSATTPQWGFVAGYREGKEAASVVAKDYPEKSGLGKACSVLILKPGVITGTRYVGNIPLPLNLVMGPTRFLMKLFSGPCSWLETRFPGLFGGVLRPAIWVEEMAAAAADVVEGEADRGVQVVGPEKLVGYKSKSE